MAPKRKLGEILVEAGIVDHFQLRSALSDQKRWGRPLGITLVKLGFVEEDELLRVLSRQLDIPIVDLKGKRIAPDILVSLPVEVAEKWRCIPLFKKREGGGDVLYLGMEDPTDLAVLDDLSFRTGLKLRPVLVGPTQLTEAIERHYHKIEWEEDAPADGGSGFGTPVEPGDTAPLVFKPEMPERAEVRDAGPELLEREPQPAAAQAPGAEADAAFDFALEAEPPGGDGSGPADAESAADDAEAASPATPELGPEFITGPGLGARAAAPAAAAPAAKPREVPTRAILRAITQLLVDKGVISREELVERIRALEADQPG